MVAVVVVIVMIVGIIMKPRMAMGASVVVGVMVGTVVMAPQAAVAMAAPAVALAHHLIVAWPVLRAAFTLGEDR